MIGLSARAEPLRVENFPTPRKVFASGPAPDRRPGRVAQIEPAPRRCSRFRLRLCSSERLLCLGGRQRPLDARGNGIIPFEGVQSFPRCRQRVQLLGLLANFRQSAFEIIDVVSDVTRNFHHGGEMGVLGGGPPVVIVLWPEWRECGEADARPSAPENARSRSTCPSRPPRPRS